MKYLAGFTLIFAAAAIAGHDTGELLPIDHEAIRYTQTPGDDAVARLQHRLDTGAAKLHFDTKFGFLASVLTELRISTSSQILVFSKTSFQSHKILPRRPRAIYFGDTAMVGFVRTGDVLELAAADPRQGTIFYTLDQRDTAKPRLFRRDICLQCHLSPVTQSVPGLMVRSVVPDWNGFPTGSTSFVTDHRSPLKDRWGGWYVTGSAGTQEHMGNAMLERPGEDRLPVFDQTRQVKDLNGFSEPNEYLTPHSDIVALMTLEHQTQMLNLITRAGWEARLGRPYEATADELVEYMLFAGEPALTSPVQGTSGFAEQFSKKGPRDSKGRSLYELDLKSRLLRYPCSFLVYSDPWDNMPAPVKDRVYRRLWEVLSGEDRSEAFANLTSDHRRAILDILVATKKGLPSYWKAVS
ncbi:MAG: hypothetical protein JWN34_5903 [Bryobacterales bacterium]|nr:hypothetical protein [Bryobacterales bacterium]